MFGSVVRGVARKLVQLAAVEREVQRAQPFQPDMGCVLAEVGAQLLVRFKDFPMFGDRVDRASRAAARGAAPAGACEDFCVSRR